MKNNKNDLVSHEYVDTFYMTKDQIEKSKKIDKETGALSGLKKFFIGCAISALGTPILGSIALATIANPILAYAAFFSIPITGSIIAMKGFFNAKRGGDRIREEISKEDESRGKHR